MKKENLRWWMESSVNKAGILDFHTHDTRHTFASKLAMAGVPIRTISELLGHKGMEMTLRYSHLSPGHLADAVSRIATFQQL